MNDFDADPRHRPSHVQGERRIITILFCDVVNSTLMAEQLDPEEWAEIMNEAFDFMIAPVYRYGGTVARLMGDGILAFFGAPVAHEDDPQRAVLAGLEIIEGMRSFCDSIMSEYDLDFSVRVGINTGPVVVGEVGSAQAGEYTAMGDAVNLASRMEQMAQPGTVQLAEDTYRLVAPLFDVERLSDMEIKGRLEPVPTFRVLGRKAEPGSVRGIEGLRTPLIGRDREIDTLRQAIAEAQNGRGQIVMLVGEAGLGKSRLIDEARQHWQGYDKPEANWQWMPSLSYDSNRPYGLFQSLLRRSYGLSNDDTPEDIRAKVAQVLANYPDELRVNASYVIERILAVAGDRHGQGRPEGEALKQDVFRLMYDLYLRLLQDNPTVVVLDDLHWADPASVELMLHLLQMIEHDPLLIIAAMRPERDTPGWELKQEAQRRYPDRFTEIDLQPLTDSDSDELVGSLLSISDIPAGLRTKILQKTEGNPYFVEEVVRTLIDSGAVARDSEGLRWLATKDVRDIDIPDNVQALVLARIDRLEAEVRQTLQVAAVVGRSFYYRVLDVIANMSEMLDMHIQVLQNVELICEAARDPELEYMFTHELTRDAAYSSILHRRRREFHRRVGEAIERLFPERREEEAHRLAYHFREGREFDRALTYYRLAGDVAARLYAHAEAATHYQEAVNIAQRDPANADELVELYQLCGRSLELRNRFSEALSTYQALEALADERGNKRFKQIALMSQAAIHAIYTQDSVPETGYPQAEQALVLARELGDRRAEAKTLWVLGLLHGFQYRQLQVAIDLAEEALAIAREDNLREELAYILHDLANAYAGLERHEDARIARSEARQLWREMGNLNMLADTLTAGAWDYYALGDLDQGIDDAEEALRISKSIDNAWGQGHSLNTLAALYVLRGDLAKARRALEDSLPLADEAHFQTTQVSAGAVLALLADVSGDYERGLQVAQELVARTEQGTSSYHMYAIWLLARLYLHSGNRAQAEALLDSALMKLPPEAYAETTHNVRYTTLAAEIAFDKGDFIEVIELADRIVNDPAYDYDESSRPLESELNYLKGSALLHLGHLDEAYAELEKARTSAENLADTVAVTRWTRNLIFAPSLQRVLWRTLYALGQVEAKRGNDPGHYYVQAKTLVQSMVAGLEDPELVKSFVVQPEIKAILEL